MATFLLSSSVYAIDIKSGIKNVGSGIMSTADSNSNVSNKEQMKKQVDIVIKKSDEITATYNTAINELASVMLSQEKVSEIKAAQKVSKKANSAETDAALANSLSDALIAITEDENAATEQIKSLSAEKREMLTNGIFDVLLANLGYVEVLGEATTLLNQMTQDPASAISMGAELKILKKVITNMPGQGKQAASVGKSLFRIAKGAGIQITPPTSSSSKAKSVKITE